MKHSPADDDRDALQKGTRSFFLPGKMMSVHCQRRGKSEMTRDVAARNKSPVEGFFPRTKYNGLIGLLRLPRRCEIINASRSSARPSRTHWPDGI